MTAVVSMQEQVRDPAMVITFAELDALHGTGPLGIALYVLLRAAMDFRTGYVGRTTTISRNGLRMRLERETTRGKGVQVVSQASLDQIDRMLAVLVDKGLLKKESGGEVLVFRMLLARTGNVRQFQTRDNAATVPATSKPLPDGPLPGEPARGFSPNPRHIRDQGSKPSTQAASTGERRVDAVDKSAAAGEISTMGTSTSKLVDVLRTEGVQVQAKSPTVARWVRQGVTVALLKGAISKARQRREEAGSAAPINVPLIDTIVTQDGQAVEQDWNKRAQAVGVSAKPGEAWPQFRRRVLDAEAARRAPR
jgi:hypothetical protein